MSDLDAGYDPNYQDPSPNTPGYWECNYGNWHREHVDGDDVCDCGEYDD